MRKRLGLLLVVMLSVILVVSLTFTSCKGTTTGGKTETGGKKFVVGYDIYYEGNVWSLQMAEEFKYGIQKDYSDMVEKVYYTSSEGDLTKQLNNFDDLIAKGCDIIFLTPMDPNGVNDKIKAAVAEGIIVIPFGTTIYGEDYTSFVNVDEFDMGKIKAEWVAKQIGGKGEVVLMNGIAGMVADASKGAMEGFAKFPDIKVVQEVFTDWDYAKTKVEMANVLQAYPDLAGVWNYDDPRACGEAFIEQNHPWIPITWEDENGALKMWKESIDKGFIGEVITKPSSISRPALDVGMRILKGEKLEKYVKVSPTTITVDQIDDYYRPDLPEQFYTITNLPDDIIKKLLSGQS